MSVPPNACTSRASGKDFHLDKPARFLRAFLRMKTTIRLFITILPFLCLSAAGPKAQAVLPPPDGGYPNFNTAEGQNALFSLTTAGAANTAVGWYSLFSDTAGSFNTATGAGSLLFNTGDNNTAFGAAALLFNTNGINNTAVGAAALLNNIGGPIDIANGGPGSFNTAIGNSALSSNTAGSDNTAIGNSALSSNTVGIDNTAIGNFALGNNVSGSFNKALGEGAGTGVTTASNVICIGASGANVDGSCFIGNIYSNVQPIVGTDPDSVTITSTGRLGRGNVSSRRYKHDIKPMDRASEALYALSPVSFRYNEEYDATQTLAFGLIAEEVAEVYSDLVGRNSNGEPESVRYEQINAMLLNEFLKEHRKVQELEAKIPRQQKDFEMRDAKQLEQIEALTARLDEQAAQLQKVSAQVQMNNSSRRVAVNRQ